MHGWLFISCILCESLPHFSEGFSRKNQADFGVERSLEKGLCWHCDHSFPGECFPRPGNQGTAGRAPPPQDRGCPHALHTSSVLHPQGRGLWYKGDRVSLNSHPNVLDLKIQIQSQRLCQLGSSGVGILCQGSPWPPQHPDSSLSLTPTSHPLAGPTGLTSKTYLG